MLTIARVTALLEAAGLELRQLDQEGRPLRNGLVVLPKRGSRTLLEVSYDGRQLPLLGGQEQVALLDRVETILTRQPGLLVRRDPARGRVLVDEQRTGAAPRTPQHERNGASGPSQRASSPRAETEERHRNKPERAPLLFLGFDVNIPAEDLRETIDAWSDYISRLEHTTAVSTTRELVTVARLRRGVAYSILGEWEQAIQDLQQVIDAQPDAPLARTAQGMLGGVYGEQGRDEAAISCWSLLLAEREQASAKEARKRSPDVPMLYLYRGMLLARQGHYQQAVADCTRAAASFPDYAEIFAVRGLARAYLGEVEEGLADCTHAIELAPTEASWHQRRGVVRMLRGDYQLALEDFRQALSLDPEHEQAQRGYLEAKLKLLLHLLRAAERAAGPEESNPPLEA